MSAELAPRTCPKCGKASDPRSKKHGHCWMHMEQAAAAYKCMIARRCEARDARHVDYAASCERLHNWMRRNGILRFEVWPKNTGFAHYLKAHGGAGQLGVLQLLERTETEAIGTSTIHERQAMVGESEGGSV